MKVRNAEMSDYERVMNVMVEWWGGRDVRSSVYKGLFIHFKNTIFIVEDEKGELVAFLLGYLSQTFLEEAYINWIGVHPQYRQTGLAKMLYEKFYDEVRTKGCTRVTCGTSLVNEASLHWHKKMGFSVIQGTNSYQFSRNI